MDDDAFLAKITRDTAVGLAIAELIYKIVQVAIATALVAFAADKTGSYTLYMMLFALMTVMAIYSLAVPVRVIELLTDGDDKDQRGGWVSHVGFLLVLIVTIGFAVSSFNLLPEIIRYLNEAAHPATAAVATQH